MKICFAFADPEQWTRNSSSYWRCEVPARALREAGYEVELRPLHDQHKRYLPMGDASDVYIIERELFGPALVEAVVLKKKGKRVYCTFDDCYDLYPKSHSIHKVWHTKINGKSILDEFHAGLSLIDGGLCTTPVLADFYSKFGTMHVVPNYFPEAWLQAPLASPQYDLGWSGSGVHLDSWYGANLKPALEKLKLSFLLNTSDFQVIEYLSSINPAVHPWVSPRDYLKVARQMAIGLAPLAGEYDRFRSNIKVLLYAVAGRPWVASDLEPYQGCEGGVVVKNKASAWAEAIQNVRANASELADKARRWASQFTIEQHLDAYTRIFV